MSTVADLPASARFLTGAANAWQGNQDGQTREEAFTWAVPWADSNAFYATVNGPVQTISYGSGANGQPAPTITRRIPLQHPYNPLMYATKLSWKGQDGPNKPANAPYAWVIITVTFGYLGFSIGDTGQDPATQSGYPPFCKVTSRAAKRVVTDISRKYTYGTSSNNTTALNQNVGVQFGGNAYQVVLYQIPDIVAWQNIVAPLCGTVNSQPFGLGAFQRAAGAVLFEGYGFEEEEDVQGNLRWTGTVDLNCSSLPWNSVYVGGSTYNLYPQPYPTADHNTLYS